MGYRGISALVFSAIGLAVLGMVAVPIYGIAWSNTHDTAVCTVESKDRTTNRDGGSNHRVYTEECGVFSVADDWINGQWNSADTYHNIEEGKTYSFEAVGWRNGFLSAFPNILSAEEVGE